MDEPNTLRTSTTTLRCTILRVEAGLPAFAEIDIHNPRRASAPFRVEIDGSAAFERVASLVGQYVELFGDETLNWPAMTLAGFVIHNAVPRRWMTGVEQDQIMRDLAKVPGVREAFQQWADADAEMEAEEEAERKGAGGASHREARSA